MYGSFVFTIKNERENDKRSKMTIGEHCALVSNFVSQLHVFQGRQSLVEDVGGGKHTFLHCKNNSRVDSVPWKIFVAVETVLFLQCKKPGPAASGGRFL